MRRLGGITGALACCVVLAASLPLGASAAPAKRAPRATAPPPAAPATPLPSATAAILVDLASGRVLFNRNVHTPLPIASLTKVATALVARERFGLEDVVTVPEDVNTVRGGKLGLKPGMQVSVRNLLYALLVVSANDAAVTLATHDPLGAANFIAGMNTKAALLGATGTHFVNPHGLDEPGHLSTVWDLALLARALLADPVLSEIVATERYSLPWPDGTVRVVRNHNRLLGRYEGTFGVKTGYTNQAGNCLIAAARLGTGTALTVVLHAGDHYAETKSLFELYKTHPVPVPALRLATPRPTPAPRAASLGARSVSSRAGQLGWAAFPMGLLGAAMLLTVRPRRKTHPIEQAAQFHPYLEPLVAADD
jgi:D-alanyl-D-alanine carboxypeptidase